MIQSVLSVIPSHAMSCFLLPVGLCKTIQSILTRFWWDSSEGEKKICWTAWETLTRPKSLGGMGFRDIQLFNVALLAKIAWRIITKPECLLAKILLGKYCHKTPFLKTAPTNSSSHGWKGILQGRDLLMNHLGKAIGDGEDTNIWTDSWINSAEDFKYVGPVLEQSQDLLVADLLTRETKEWNKALVEKLFPELSHLIFSIRPSLHGSKDAYIWTEQQSGTYSVKSGYYSAYMEKLQSTPTLLEDTMWDWKKYIWNPDLLPKIKLFLWKCAQNGLPTGENLQRRGVLDNVN